MFGRTVCKSMVAYPPSVKKVTQRRQSLRNASKARVVIVCVITSLRIRWGQPAADDATSTTVTRARRGHRVFPIESPRLSGQCTFAVAEHGAIFRVAERASGANQTFGGLGFLGQVSDYNDVGRSLRPSCKYPSGRHDSHRKGDSEPQLSNGLPLQRPACEKHGFSPNSESAMVPNRAGNLKPLPQIGAVVDVD
jgi:hypothetical protein